MLRGIAIIAVIMIHSMNSNLDDNTNTIIQIVMRQFINFAVPLFIFMSGYFTKQEDVIADSKKYIFKRLTKLVPPFLIWSVIGILTANYFSVKSTIKNLIFGKAFVQLYFIIVLIQIIFLLPFIVKTIDQKVLRILMFTVTPAYLAILYVYIYKTNSMLQNGGVFFATWFIFYYLGLLIRSLNISPSYFKSKLKFLVIAYIIMLSASIVESFLIYRNLSLLNFAISQMKYSTFAMSLLFIIVLFSLSETIKVSSKNILVTIGNYSFGIYLAHCLILRWLTRLSFLSKITNQLAYTLFTSSLVLVITLAVCIVGKKALGKFSYIVGF